MGKIFRRTAAALLIVASLMTAALVGAVQCENKTFQLTDRTTAVVVVATLKAKIDPKGIYAFIKRDEKEKVTIVQQNDGLQDTIAKNDKEFEDLKEQYKRATTQAERDRIRKQLNDADRDFLTNEKLEAGNKLAYAENYHGAIKLYNEALQLKPNFDKAYNNRGIEYALLGNFNQAIADSTKAIELNPNYAEAYQLRGLLYQELGDEAKAKAEFVKAKELGYNG